MPAGSATRTRDITPRVSSRLTAVCHGPGKHRQRLPAAQENKPIRHRGRWRGLPWHSCSHGPRLQSKREAVLQGLNGHWGTPGMWVSTDKWCQEGVREREGASPSAVQACPLTGRQILQAARCPNKDEEQNKKRARLMAPPLSQCDLISSRSC